VKKKNGLYSLRQAMQTNLVLVLSLSLSLSLKPESILTGSNISVLQLDGEKLKVFELYFL